jgi:hypothetical protein
MAKKTKENLKIQCAVRGVRRALAAHQMGLAAVSRKDAELAKGLLERESMQEHCHDLERKVREAKLYLDDVLAG